MKFGGWKLEVGALTMRKSCAFMEVNSFESEFKAQEKRKKESKCTHLIELYLL